MAMSTNASQLLKALVRSRFWKGHQCWKRTFDRKRISARPRRAAAQGISRRISTIPHEFKVGKTWVAFAHIKACKKPLDPEKPKVNLVACPGIFMLSQPTSIEYVVTGKETQEELAALVERGITPVKVIRSGPPANRPLEDDEDL